ncbi:MAG: PDR/VanB family oxidoreductase [Bdellovibrionota bacterium]
MKVKIEKIENLAVNIKMFTLIPLDSTVFPDFQPGAHIEVKLSIKVNGTVITRHYSLVSSPRDLTHYKIAVLKDPMSRGGSSFLHESISIDDEFEISEPRNEFNLSEDTGYSILIAGGIGITPIFSFAQQLSASRRPFELHYAARSIEYMAFRNDIERQFAKSARFYEGTNRLSIEDLLRSVDAKNCHVYVCGPRSMIEDVKYFAKKLNWEEANVHFENFGISAGQSNSVQVELVRSKKIIEVKNGKSILDAILESGIDASYSCKRGQCGCCKTRLLEGNVEHRDVCLTDEEEKGICALAFLFH